MKKTILITGASDGLGLATAKMLTSLKQDVIIHTRDEQKLNSTLKELNLKKGCFCDLSIMQNVKNLSQQIINDNIKIDVLINNAGIFKVPNTRTADALDIRFAVNTIAPYILTKNILPILNDNARVINLASAAQASVDINALLGKITVATDIAYAMSKLALIITRGSYSY